MGVSFDAISTGASDATTTTVSHTVASESNLVLVVLVAIGNSTGVSQIDSVTWNGTGCTSVGFVDDGSDSACEVFYLINPDTGTHNCIVDYLGSATPDAGVAVVSVYGADQTDPIGFTGSNTGIGTDIGTDVTAEAANSMIFDVVSMDDDGAPLFTPDSGQTERADFLAGAGAGDFTMGVSSRTTSGAGSYHMGHTASTSDYWAQYVVEVKESTSYVTKTFTVDGIIKQQNTKTFTVDGLILSGVFKTFTIDGIITIAGGGAWTLGDMTLPRPKEMSRSRVYTKQDVDTLSGSMGRDIGGDKEKFTLYFENLTEDEVNSIMNEVAKNTAVNFSITQDYMEIPTTSVFPEVVKRSYDKNFTYKLQLELTEAT